MIEAGSRSEDCTQTARLNSIQHVVFVQVSVFDAGLMRVAEEVREGCEEHKAEEGRA